MKRKDKAYKVYSQIANIRKQLNELNDELEEIQTYVVDELMFKEEKK